MAVSTSANAAEPSPLTTPASPASDENSGAEVLWEWDPYYTDVGINIPLTSKPIPTITSDSESVIYRNLIKDSAIPRYMTLEASIYPMPVLGTYLKKHTPGFYSQGQIGGGGINIFDSITAGFQEPWAVSMFFGNIAKLVRPGETRTGSNMGYTGYLVSGGIKHIKNNVLIDDNWYELEWKIKGKLDYPDEKMSWSFRFGGKFNSNPDITDVFYFSIHRSNLDHRAPFLHWLKNSALDLKVQFSQHGGQVVREELIIGKKYPVDGKSYSATLDAGFVWESPDEYIGALRNRTRSSLTLLLRPSIEF
ncbi:MAG: hypothetical protein HY935_01635 [Nitrosomonadales bacterium]|nr:hypothetical protein [Nitrosomonadales bacterium]